MPRAALVLERLRKGDLAGTYRASALGAMRWAEKRFENHGYAKLPHAVVDARNLAAAELWRLTGDAAWHDVFRATTAFADPKADIYVWQSHEQGDAAFVYACTERQGTDAGLKQNCRAALIRAADVCADLARTSSFGYVRRNAWHPFIGLMGAPRAVELVRAHRLTGEAKYLAAAVLACQCGAGANPDNLCYTTGLGHKSPLHPLVVDQRMTGQAPPPGITVYGPMDLSRRKHHWALNILRPLCTPPAQEWPTTEAYFDMYLFPEVCEFTVMQSLGPNAYAWGYLAARK